MPVRAKASVETKQKRRWAIVRLILGQLQVAGASATLVFLIQTGVSSWTIITCALAGCVTLTSWFLFRSRWKKI